METRLINYGIILLIFYASWVIYNQEEEVVKKDHLLNEAAGTIIKQRKLIDAQSEYIKFLENPVINSPIYPSIPPKIFKKPI